MFISKIEKLKLITGMMDLMATVQKLDSEVIFLKAKIKAFEGGKTPPKKPRKKSTMTAESRAKISAAVRARHAKKKLERENVTSISTKSI